MFENYNNYGYQQPQQRQTPYYQCIPVSSREEALSCRVDFATRGLIMHDLPHGRIYVKLFNEKTGSTEFGDFVFTEPKPEPQPEEYLTVKAFNEYMTKRFGEVTNE